VPDTSQRIDAPVGQSTRRHHHFNALIMTYEEVLKLEGDNLSAAVCEALGCKWIPSKRSEDWEYLVNPDGENIAQRRPSTGWMQMLDGPWVSRWLFGTSESVALSLLSRVKDSSYGEFKGAYSLAYYPMTNNPGGTHHCEIWYGLLKHVQFDAASDGVAVAKSFLLMAIKLRQ
jgi:hypothetical protein